MCSANCGSARTASIFASSSCSIHHKQESAIKARAHLPCSAVHQAHTIERGTTSSDSTTTLAPMFWRSTNTEDWICGATAVRGDDVEIDAAMAYLHVHGGSDEHNEGDGQRVHDHGFPATWQHVTTTCGLTHTRRTNGAYRLRTRCVTRLEIVNRRITGRSQNSVPYLRKHAHAYQQSGHGRKVTPKHPSTATHTTSFSNVISMFNAKMTRPNSMPSRMAKNMLKNSDRFSDRRDSGMR